MMGKDCAKTTISKSWHNVSFKFIQHPRTSLTHVEHIYNIYKLNINIHSVTIFTIHLYLQNETVTVIDDTLKEDSNNVYKHTNYAS